MSDVSSVEEFLLEQDYKSPLQKTLQDVRLLLNVLKTKDDNRKIEDIPPAELNIYCTSANLSSQSTIKMAMNMSRHHFEVYASFEQHLTKRS